MLETSPDVLSFPPDFLWGTATSAHQVEGHQTHNDWSAFEQKAGTIYHDQQAGDACDWWHRAEADFDRMAEMGQSSHRLSLEWSRLQPEPDAWSDEALRRYREMLSGLRTRGLEPMVTLYHFTLPRWLAEQGGWENADSVRWFETYVRRVASGLGDLVHLWCTINEPMVLVGQGYMVGTWPPAKKDLPAARRATINLARAHVAAYHALHEVQSSPAVGLAKHMVDWQPDRVWLPTDHLISWLMDWVTNQAFLRAVTAGQVWVPGQGYLHLDRAENTLDWLGINYYQRYRVGAKIRSILRNVLPGPAAEIIYQSTHPRRQKGPGPWGEIYPAGLYHALRAVGRYDVPIYITENGIPDAHDENRPRFIFLHLQQVWKALQQGLPIKGYFHWSLVDNFEWDKGYNPAFRFGLWGVDFETQERLPRISGQVYEAICQQGAIRRELVQHFDPEIVPQLFDG